MSKITLPAMEVNTEDFGFPASATPTPEEVMARVTKLNEQVIFWHDKANKVQLLHARQKEDQQKLKDMECKLLLDGAVQDFKISRSEVAFFTNMYKKDPMGVKEHIEALSAREYLKREEGLNGDDTHGPAASVELASKVLELRANYPKMTEAEAVREAYKRTKGLFERVTEERRSLNGSTSDGGAK